MVTNFFELATTLKNLGNQKKKIDFSLGASSKATEKVKLSEPIPLSFKSHSEAHSLFTSFGL